MADEDDDAGRYYSSPDPLTDDIAAPSSARGPISTITAATRRTLASAAKNSNGDFSAATKRAASAYFGSRGLSGAG